MIGRDIVLALLLGAAAAQPAAAEPELRFRDGRTVVWPSYYEKGDQYCTLMDYGELCVPKRDVASITSSAREADGLYRAPSVTLSDRAQREQAERRKRQDQDAWRSIEDSQRRRSQEDSYRRQKHGTGRYDEDEGD